MAPPYEDPKDEASPDTTEWSLHGEDFWSLLRQADEAAKARAAAAIVAPRRRHRNAFLQHLFMTPGNIHRLLATARREVGVLAAKLAAW